MDLSGVEGGDVEGDGGRAGRCASTSWSGATLDKVSMCWFRIKSMKEGRALKRGRKPTFIKELSCDWQVEGKIATFSLSVKIQVYGTVVEHDQECSRCGWLSFLVLLHPPWKSKAKQSKATKSYERTLAAGATRALLKVTPLYAYFYQIRDVRILFVIYYIILYIILYIIYYIILYIILYYILYIYI